MFELTWDSPADPTFWPSGDGGPQMTNLSDDLEEVVEAARAGFGVIGPEPGMWDWLWILWPRSHRTWVVDRRIRTYDDGRQPWPCAEYAEVENEANRRLRLVGLPDRPMGRIWLVRPPSDSANLESCLDDLAEMLEEGGAQLVLSPSLVTAATSSLRQLFQHDSRTVW